MPLLTTAEAAQYLKCSESTMRKMRMTEDGPRFHRLGKKLVRYNQAELDKYLEQREYKTTTQARVKGPNR